jgi:hypothetical protein
MRWRKGLIARFWRWTPRRSGLVLVVAATLLAMRVHADSGLTSDWFSPEPVEVRIGTSVYAIPRNYLVHVSTAIDGKTANIVMRALWPGLEPLRPDNAHLWDRRQPKQQIHFGLMRQPRDGYSQLQGFVRLRRARAEPADFGLTRYRSHLTEYYVGEGIELRRPDGSPVALRCRDYPDKTKAIFEVERACIVEYPLSDGVGLHYRFFMVNLEQWRGIDQAVRRLVDGFRRPKEAE